MDYKLRRKVDDFLIHWKQNTDRMPLIIKGARQIGKTSSIEHFAESYKYFIEINFITEPQYLKIFSSGFKTLNLGTISPTIKFKASNKIIVKTGSRKPAPRGFKT